MKAGRYFLHEHPQAAASWKEECMQEIMNSPLVYVINAHQCMFGLESEDADGKGLAKQPTTFLTNSIELAKALDRQCDGSHRHVQLMEWRARAAAIYPRESCRAVCRGIKCQARADAGNMMTTQCKDNSDGSAEIGNVEWEEEPWMRYWDHWART